MWIHDLRHALRLLAARPGFTFVAVLTLALGIGANTAIFSVVDGVLLRPAPYDDMDRLVMIWETDRDSGTTREPASVPDFIDFRQRSERVARMGALLAREVNFTPDRGGPVRLPALLVTHDLMPALGVEPLLGRGFTEQEIAAGTADVALIGEGLWGRAFANDPGIVGRTIRLDDRPLTIVGVMPEASDFGVFQVLSAAAYSRSFADRGVRADVDIWAPLPLDPQQFPRDTHPIMVLGRLAPGATVRTAQEELAGIAADLERDYPSNNARGVHVEPLDAVVLGPARPALLVMLGAVALVLLVACANVAHLLLARGVARRREVAIRSALGAGWSRLARQFLAESLLLTSIAAVAGIALAQAGLALLVGLAPADVPRIAEVALDWRVLGVTLAVSMAIGIVFGLVPTLQARRVELATALKAGGGSGASAGRGSRRLHSALVVGELALAVVLVIGAGLMVRSFWRLQQVEPGFHAGGVLKAQYNLPRSRYPVDFSRWPDFTEIHAFNAGLLEKARALPGVTSAAIAGNHPLDPGFTNSFTVVGREAEARDWPEISIRRVTPGYFRTMGVRLIGGRLLDDRDATDAPPVLLINQAAARRFFADGDPLGERIAFWGTQRTIVGVVGDERFTGLTEAPRPAVYTPLSQTPPADGAATLLVRAEGDPASLAGPVRDAVAGMDPGLAVFAVEPLDETLARSTQQRRFTMLVLGLFAAVALLLAMVGIHGVLSYAVRQRTREIGIRMALGARPAGVLRLVVGQGLWLALGGVAAGLVGAFALTRLMSSLLFGVEPTDLATFALVPPALIAAAAAASYLPARRATRVDPVRTLRAE